MYLLDTNHLSQLLAGDQRVVTRLTSLGSTPVATCAIVRGELIFMAAKSEHRQANLRRVESLLQKLPIHPVDSESADWYGTLKAALIDHFGPKERAKRRRATIASIGVSENDLWVAAVAKRHGLVVVSTDDDFRRIQEVTDLVVESWLDMSPS